MCPEGPRTHGQKGTPLVTPDQDEFRRRAIRAALTVAGIAVVIGLVIGGITASVVNLTGLVPDAPASTPLPTPGTDDENALPTPSLLPTTTPSPSASASASASETEVAEKPSKSPSHKRDKKPKNRNASDIRLRASESSVAAYEEVTLSGSYPGANGTTLSVQRFEGGSWTGFPTTATVDGGRFSTFVASGQQGQNRFRVVDPDSGEASNVVVFNVS
jgi:hypothetical protein